MLQRDSIHIAIEESAIDRQVTGTMAPAGPPGCIFQELFAPYVPSSGSDMAILATQSQAFCWPILTIPKSDFVRGNCVCAYEIYGPLREGWVRHVIRRVGARCPDFIAASLNGEVRGVLIFNAHSHVVASTGTISAAVISQDRFLESGLSAGHAVRCSRVGSDLLLLIRRLGHTPC